METLSLAPRISRYIIIDTIHLEMAKTRNSDRQRDDKEIYNFLQQTTLIHSTLRLGFAFISVSFLRTEFLLFG